MKINTNSKAKPSNFQWEHTKTKNSQKVNQQNAMFLKVLNHRNKLFKISSSHDFSLRSFLLMIHKKWQNIILKPSFDFLDIESVFSIF